MSSTAPPPSAAEEGRHPLSAAEEERFAQLCEKVRRECFSDGQDAAQKDEEAKLAQTVLGAWRKQFEAPCAAAMEIVLRKNTPDAMARQLLFFPEREDMDFWPNLLSQAPDGAPKEHPQAKCLVAALPIFYLRHSRDWTLCRPFILAGGLAALSDLLVCENLYLRSQALESFSRLTDQSNALDWLDTSDGEARVRFRLFQLSQGTLVPNLLRNRKGSYPGGSATALRCVAFFLSWLRHLYTNDKVLYVRQIVLDAFKEWQALEDKTLEERELAKTLSEDFGRWPSIEERAAQGAAGGDPGAVGPGSVGGAQWKDPLEQIQEESPQGGGGGGIELGGGVGKEVRSGGGGVGGGGDVLVGGEIRKSEMPPGMGKGQGEEGGERERERQVRTAGELKGEGNDLLKAGLLREAEAKYSVRV
jgi:hypothetical protein